MSTTAPEDDEVRGELAGDRQTNQAPLELPAAAPSVMCDCSAHGVEGEAKQPPRLRRSRSSGSGTSKTRASSSSSTASRNRIRRSESTTEPVPPIPDIYLSVSSSSSSGAPRVNVPATRTRPNLTPGEGEGDKQPTKNASDAPSSLDSPRNSVLISRSTSRGRGRGIDRANSTGRRDKSNGTRVGEREQRAPEFKRRQSLPLHLHAHAKCSTSNLTPKMPRSVASDIFLDPDVATEQENMTSPRDTTVHAHHRRPSSRTSYIDKRRSLPADMPRPSTSHGGANSYARPSPRLHHASRASTDLQRHMDQYSGPTTSRLQNDDTVSQAGHRRRFTAMIDRSPLSPRSPEMPQYGRRRPSFGVVSPSSRERRQVANQESQDESRTDNSEQKQAESASGDSQSVDTVWDELDDLKSRIKKLELTGKLPPTSSAAVSGGSSDRPRTATTAPTTIDSSPKQGRKQETPGHNTMTPPPQPDTPITPAGAATANIHPLLHSALAKAKPLLNSTLFRSLEATASDALQLAAMTGSAGPQGTTFSAASIINGVTVSDRHVRRKADNMCRNLTDLCLALCEGKHEAPSAFSSPSTMDPVLQRSPSLRYTRSGLNSASTVRPASRLEARRSSILGAPPSTASDVSPRGSVGDMSGYDQEQSPPQQSYLQAPVRVSRAPSSRLRNRLQSHDDVSGNEDEDLTVRPLSRAMTDAGAFRTRPRIISESRTPGPGQHRNSSLRDTLVSSRSIDPRSNEDAYENNRMSSYSTDPRLAGSDPPQRRKQQLYHSTPPVTEEDDTLRGDFYSTLQSRRRVTSSSSQQQYASSRRAAADTPSRALPGLQQRRHVIVE